MKKIIPFLLLCVVLFVNCKGKTNSNTEAITGDLFTVDNLLASADQLVGKTITVEGLCTHLCTHSGKKLFLEGSADSITLRAEAEKPFRQECIDKKVNVTGKLIEERIDEAYLVDWETEIASDSTTHEGCTAEQKAVGQKEMNSAQQRIADFRAKIADEKAKSGKDYLAFYHIETESYRVVE